MALNLDERYPGRANGKTLAYPQGSFKNRTSPNSQDGTYLEEDWANDWAAFFQSLIAEAGFTANGVVDTVGASQYFDALVATIKSQSLGYATFAEINALIGDEGPIICIDQGGAVYVWGGSGYVPLLASELRAGAVRFATTAEAQALANDTKALTPKKLLDSGAVFAGEVRVFAGAEANIPEGWLPCNGAAISRTTYSRLFGVIGTAYGSGNGSTTFNLPDLRGEFIRGLDNGRGVDAGRIFGSWQSDDLRAHRHDLLIIGVQGGSLADAGPGALRGATSGLRRDAETTPVAFTDAVDLSGGLETRVRNVAMNYIIKY